LLARSGLVLRALELGIRAISPKRRGK